MGERLDKLCFFFHQGYCQSDYYYIYFSPYNLLGERLDKLCFFFHQGYCQSDIIIIIYIFLLIIYWVKDSTSCAFSFIRAIANLILLLLYIFFFIWWSPCQSDIIIIIYICYYLLFFIWWSPFIPSRNLDEVFTYNHIWL